MTLQKLSLSLSEMGLCPFPTQYGAGAFSEEAALQLFTMQLRSLGDYLHRARLPEGTSCCPSAEQQHFASCFQNLRVSNCAAARSLLPCEDKKRSSSRGQPASFPPGSKEPWVSLGLLQPPAFSPSHSGYKAPASQLVRWRKTIASQLLIIPLPLDSLLFPVLWKSHDVN